MKTSQRGVDLIKRYEGCRLTAYRDSAGVLTIGFGHTGPDVRPGLKISQEQADAWLVQDLAGAERAVSKLVTLERLPQCQFDALVSFAFNLGAGSLQRSTLLRILNAGQELDVPAELLKWRKAGGKVLKGLIRRRVAEAALYLED